MEIEVFTHDERVLNPLIAFEDALRRSRKRFSDVVDDDGHQYIDLVLEGGGVLGIALVGYTYALEHFGFRFLSVGGTSAGAINALLIAALGTPAERKSEKLIELLAGTDMFEFVDGDSDARDFTRAIAERAGIIKLGWKGWQVLDDLNDDLGLNPGTVFLRWLRQALATAGIRSSRDLRAKMRKLPRGIRAGRERITVRRANPRLAIVAADVTTETKVVFPEMAPLYWRDPDAVNPAQYVRASMSIPYFFHPYRVRRIPRGPEAVRRWRNMAGYTGMLPREAVFVDGGIMSNFPIDLFHSPRTPRMPTFGVKLGHERSEPQDVSSPLKLGGAVFNAARHYADYDFLFRNPDYRQLVAHIDTGGHYWLDFFMDEETKVDLFARGVAAAVRFLRGFDWQGYKRLRAGAAGSLHRQ